MHGSAVLVALGGISCHLFGATLWDLLSLLLGVVI